MTRCECEHYSHSDTRFKTPQGNKAHPYGALFSMAEMEFVETPDETLHVCLSCAQDCLEKWYEKMISRRQMGHS